MATAISNQDLVDKCKRFKLADPVSEALDELIQDALITANREINEVDSIPLAWLRETYNALFTRTYAEISAVTQANPAVVTAESMDDDITDNHGFSADDIVYINGIDGMDELNYRFFRVSTPSDTTLGLYQLNNQITVNSSGYDAYSSGGYVYHAGLIIPHGTIEPSGSDPTDWKIKKVFKVLFDSNP